jgi:hypothetical protein
MEGIRNRRVLGLAGGEVEPGPSGIVSQAYELRGHALNVEVLGWDECNTVVGQVDVSKSTSVDFFATLSAVHARVSVVRNIPGSLLYPRGRGHRKFAGIPPR